MADAESSSHAQQQPDSHARPSKRLKDDDAGKQAPGKSASERLFRCGDCDKSYSRVDHLARHVRQHTQERPYVCHTCSKGFARADLLKRHASVHSSQSGQSPRNFSRASNRQCRVNQACEACAELHLKCENEKPCTRCKSKGIYCRDQNRAVDDEAVAHDLLSLAQGPAVEPVSVHRPGPGSSISVPSSNGFEAQPALNTSQKAVNQVRADTERAESATVQPFALDAPGQAANASALSNGFGNSHGAPEGHDLRDLLQDVIGQDMIGQDGLMAPPSEFHSSNWMSRNVFDLGFDTNLELDDVDFSFLMDYSQNNPFAPNSNGPASVDSSEATSTSNPPLGVESLQKSSTWRFLPNSNDNHSSNLSLPERGSTKRFTISRRMTSETMSYTMRDQMLLMATNAGIDKRSISSFPSLELLDSLLQNYLISAPESSRFLHLPTLCPNKIRPELCLAMVAAGAVLTPDATLRKLGFALQEAVRVAIPIAVEKSNLLARDLQLIQASVIALKIALWSGNSRKMEIAESFLQMYTTMMRRGGYYSRKPDISLPAPQDSGSALEDKWHAWVERESRKRLVFLVQQHDTQSSISLLVNPVISYAEINLPLPYPESLWRSKSAQIWKATILSQPQFKQQPISTIDLLRNIDGFRETQSLLDEKIAVQSLLSSSWALVRDYRQRCSTFRGTQNPWGRLGLILSPRPDELQQLFECLRLSCPLGPAAAVCLEIQSLHLYMSLEEVHMFAGVEGHEESRRVYPNLLSWVQTKSSRQAVWHAGQVIRHARQVPCIRDFEAVAVYQAALALWSFGVLSNANSNSFTGPRSEEDIILLDASDGNVPKDYIELERGRPYLSSLTGRVPLSSPGLVMSSLIDLFRSSHRSSPPPPPLVGNLVDLIGSLRAAVMNSDDT